MLVTKGRDSKISIGNGLVNQNSENNRIISGTMNDRGLFYGRNDVNTVGCKVFGIENYWGNLCSFLAGFITTNSSGAVGIKKCSPYSDSSHDITIAMSSFWSGFSFGTWLYPTKQKEIISGAAILPSKLQSVAIGWPEPFNVLGVYGCVAYCGGAWNSSPTDAGASSCFVGWNTAHTDSHIGARLAAAR